jgi:putative NIF3 family GTP cyclohydrolase 1 type 2
MFSVEWLRNGVAVEKETSAVANVADAVAAARARADVIVARHPREEPDTFRLIDPSGAVLITFKFLTKRL